MKCPITQCNLEIEDNLMCPEHWKMVFSHDKMVIWDTVVMINKEGETKTYEKLGELLRLLEAYQKQAINSVQRRLDQV